jgi:putative sigma-54 modulation protein
MEITIRGVDLRVPPNLEDYAHSKLIRLERYLPNIANIRLELSREHTRRGEDLAVAQITVRHTRGAILRAEERVPGDPQTAVNLALDKMYHQIERFKGRQSRKGRERFTATVEEVGAAETAPTQGEIAYDQVEEAATEPLVARHKDILVEPMTEAEAIAQMELLGHTFFVFQNDETGAVNVVYRRRDASYGVIVPRTS